MCRYLSICLIATVGLVGCQTRHAAPEELIVAPEAWVRAEGAQTLADDAWLKQLGDDVLPEVIAGAVDNNYQLAAARSRLEQARQTAVIAKAPRLPNVSLTLDRNRRRIVRNFTGDALDDGVVNQVASANLNLNWQIDLWGELAADARRASYDYAAAEATFVDARRQLAADIARAHYGLAEAAALESVAEEQLKIAKAALDVVDRGYQAGLNESLDVYLAQTTVAQSEDILAARTQNRKIAAANLELLGAAYPSGTRAAPQLPNLQDVAAIGVPSDLLPRRPDLQIAWLNLLSADATH